MVDCAAQEQGLSGDAKQKLYLYAIQTSPPTYALWLCAATLHNESAINNATNSMAGLSTRVDTLMDLTCREYHVPRMTKTMLKKIQWHFIVTAKVSYHTILDRVKAFVAHNSQMFGLNLYIMDSTVRQAVDQVIDRDIYQCRGTFCKAIFTDTISGQPLGDASNRICSVLSAEVGSPAPRYIQAHIAQLHLIAFERIAAIWAAEQAVAAAAQASSGGSESINTIAPQVQASHCPQNNTGFWIAIHVTFNELGA
ncbi:hypothetical protein FRC11_011471 [Ceratobasidium sp. 423]|nr:hypothetical protein FRC11_011471 [Ceratobasidium sp. 423]